MQPSDFGLNVDSRIRQSRSLTCAPLEVFSFQIPYSTPLESNGTVFWVGYTSGHFNESAKYNSLWETILYYYPYPLPNPRQRMGVQAWL